MREPRGQVTASAVINNAPGLKNTPTIRVKSYDNFERIAQDKRRSKLSRVERTPADKEWIDAFRWAILIHLLTNG
jgi:hypothetical protein